MQLLERHVGPVVLRIDLEDPARTRSCPVSIVDLPVPDVRDLEQLADLLLGLRQGLGALHLDVDDVRPLLLVAVDGLEGVHRLEIAGSTSSSLRQASAAS